MPVIQGTVSMSLFCRKLKRLSASSLCAAGFIVLAGCTRLPLGISSDDWERLSFEERFQARMEQADLDIQSARRRTALAELNLIKANEQEVEVLQQIISFEERLRRR